MGTAGRRVRLALLTATVAGSGVVGTGGAAEAAQVQGIAGRSGDFNGDGFDDIISFANNWPIVVAPNVPPIPGAGRAFRGNEDWGRTWPSANEVPVIGDFDGNGRDDALYFTVRS